MTTLSTCRPAAWASAYSELCVLWKSQASWYGTTVFDRSYTTMEPLGDVSTKGDATSLLLVVAEQLLEAIGCLARRAGGLGLGNDLLAQLGHGWCGKIRGACEIDIQYQAVSREQSSIR